MTDMISAFGEDTDWHAYGSREEYRAAKARQVHEEAVGRRQYAEAVVRNWEAEVARVSGTNNGIPWGDAGSKPRYEAELDEARGKLAACWEREKAARQAWDAAYALARPTPPTDAEQQLDRAKRDLAEVEARGRQVDAELAGARDRVTTLREDATREKDAVKAALIGVDVAVAQADIAKLEAEQADLPRRVEWHKAWVAVKQADVDGDNDALIAALDALDAYDETQKDD